MLAGRERRRFFLFCILPYVAAMALFLCWRWNSYHDLLPNTFYSKTGGGLGKYLNGIKYLLSSVGLLFTPILPLFFLAVFKGWKRNKLMILALCFMLVEGIFVIYSGGDWMPGARFLIPIVPIVIVAAMIGFSYLEPLLEKWSVSSPQFAAAVIGIALAWTFAGRVTIRAEAKPLPTGFSSLTGHHLADHQLAADWLALHAKDSATFACGEAGLIGYVNSGLRILDLNGLIDRHIAQMRKDRKPYDVDYVLNKKPDFILLYGVGGADDQLKNNQISTDYNAALLMSPRFLSAYHFVVHLVNFDIYAVNQ